MQQAAFPTCVVLQLLPRLLQLHLPVFVHVRIGSCCLRFQPRLSSCQPLTLCLFCVTSLCVCVCACVARLARMFSTRQVPFRDIDYRARVANIYRWVVAALLVLHRHHITSCVTNQIASHVTDNTIGPANWCGGKLRVWCLLCDAAPCLSDCCRSQGQEWVSSKDVQGSASGKK